MSDCDIRKTNTREKRYAQQEWIDLREKVFPPFETVLCVRCKRSDIVSLAIVCDHIFPRVLYPHLALSLSNLQPLCKKCHTIKTNHERMGKAYDYINGKMYVIEKPSKQAA